MSVFSARLSRHWQWSLRTVLVITRLVRIRYLPCYVMASLRNASGPFIWPEGICLVRSYLLPLKPLDYQLIYAAHHLYPSFLYIQGFEGYRALDRVQLEYGVKR